MRIIAKSLLYWFPSPLFTADKETFSSWRDYRKDGFCFDFPRKIHTRDTTAGDSNASSDADVIKTVNGVASALAQFSLSKSLKKNSISISSVREWKFVPIDEQCVHVARVKNVTFELTRVLMKLFGCSDNCWFLCEECRKKLRFDEDLKKVILKIQRKDRN